MTAEQQAEPVFYADGHVRYVTMRDPPNAWVNGDYRLVLQGQAPTSFYGE